MKLFDKEKTNADIKQQQEYDTLLAIITSELGKSPLHLAEFCANTDPSTRETLNSDKFAWFWAQRFNNLRVKDNNAFRFRDPTPESKMNFYCGYVLYIEALSNEDKGQTLLAADYKKKSLNLFHSFHALQNILLSLTIACMNDCNQTVHLLNYIQQNQTQINNFQTPGFLLLADVYFSLMFLYHENREKGLEYYQKCWQYLHLAELFEKSSSRDIHNAYFGKGLRACSSFEGNTVHDFKNHTHTIAALMNIRISTEHRTLLEGHIEQQLAQEASQQIEQELLRLPIIEIIHSAFMSAKKNHDLSPKKRQPTSFLDVSIENTTNVTSESESELDDTKPSPEPSPRFK